MHVKSGLSIVRSGLSLYFDSKVLIEDVLFFKVSGINGLLSFARAIRDGTRMDRTCDIFPPTLMIRVGGNYYANYFSEGSDWCDGGYGDFLVCRGLTRDFAEVFGERNVRGRVGGWNPHLKSEMWVLESDYL